MKRVHLIIHGRVQGVSFRYFVEHSAESLGLAGWAKNLEEDKVEIIAEGEEENLKKLVELCRKGPPLSRVLDIDVEYEDYKGEFKDFDIKHDFY